MSVIVKSSFTILFAGAFAPSFCPSYVAVEQVQFENPGSSTGGSSESTLGFPTTSMPPGGADSTTDGVEGSGNSGTSGSITAEGATTSESTGTPGSDDSTLDTNTAATTEEGCGGNDDECRGGSFCSSNCTWDVVRYIFVSEARVNGASSDSDICAMEAMAHGLPGKYRAWRGSQDGASWPASWPGSVGYMGPYVLPGVDGGARTLIALGWSDLSDESIINPINRMADGATVLDDKDVWTGVFADGTGNPLINDCDFWTTDKNKFPWSGSLGDVDAVDATWTYNVWKTKTCEKFARVFCLQTEG